MTDGNDDKLAEINAQLSTTIPALEGKILGLERKLAELEPEPEPCSPWAERGLEKSYRKTLERIRTETSERYAEIDHQTRGNADKTRDVLVEWKPDILNGSYMTTGAEAEIYSAFFDSCVTDQNLRAEQRLSALMEIGRPTLPRAWTPEKKKGVMYTALAVAAAFLLGAAVGIGGMLYASSDAAPAKAPVRVEVVEQGK